jgi:hypothetical protein
MKHRLVFISLLLLALSLAVAPTALASSTWYVDGLNGSDNNNCKSDQHACKTIGHAISLAHAGDSIMVAAATYTENLTIGIRLKIVGARANATIIYPNDSNEPVVGIAETARVVLSKVTISGGRNSGVLNNGTLTINNSIIIHNAGQRRNGISFGGGIYNLGAVTINNSTVSQNEASGGGGIYSRGTVTINRSTISLNNGALGAGVFSQFGTPLVITNSTISGNSASVGAGIASGTTAISNSTISGNNADSGGGIGNGTATLQNSIVANNGGGNCYNSGITSKGYNLSSDGSCNFNKTGDRNNTDPKLGALGNYGGPTQTLPLLHGSPAIDTGNPSGCTDGNGHLLKTDQRGFPRPDKEDTGGCDMGAFERQKDQF